MSETMEHKIADEVENKGEAFEEQQGIMEKIRVVGFAEYVKTLENLPAAFDLEKHQPVEGMHKCICCMDGRTPYGIHSAGSGMLLTAESFKQYIQESRPDSISSHEGCGAAKIYCRLKGIPLEQSDEIVKQWAKEMAEKYGLKYTHLGVEKDFHYERVCYYDGTGRFNYKDVEGLPVGFVVGRKFMAKEASLAECGVANDIIFGDHGFGPQLLNKENPFLFVAVADNQDQLNKLKEELRELTKDMGDSVVIDGFISPIGAIM